MTDEAKALVEALKRDTLTYDQRWKLVDIVETQAREIERLRGALKTADAWLDRWARHIGDCPGIDDCTCGLTRVRYEAITALAGDSHDHTIKRGTECPYSHDGFHHVDTSMESGPNNCFHCERPI